MLRWLRSQRGVTLVEVLIAVIIIGMVASVVFFFNSQYLHFQIKEEQRAQAYAYASQIIEQVKRGEDLASVRDRWQETAFDYVLEWEGDHPRKVIVTMYKHATGEEELARLTTYIE